MDTAACVMEITAVTDALDSYNVGWAYWQFKTYADLTTSAGTGSEGFYNNDGTLQYIKVKALARTYLPYSQGILTNNTFDSITGNFVGSFTYDASIEEATILYKSDTYYYQKGYSIEVSS
jgi:endoglycosylceramidase